MDILERAIEVAAKAHRKQFRKGTEDVPYITHPYCVGVILLKAGCPDDWVAAGILHDTLEDTNLDLTSLTQQFGENIARIVSGCSEPDKSLSWENRKQHTLDFLISADNDIKVVTCADKLANIRTINEEHQRIGEKVWGRFKRGREKQEWYYRGLVDSLETGYDERFIAILIDLKSEVTNLFG